MSKYELYIMANPPPLHLALFTAIYLYLFLISSLASNQTLSLSFDVNYVSVTKNTSILFPFDMI